MPTGEEYLRATAMGAKSAAAASSPSCGDDSPGIGELNGVRDKLHRLLKHLPSVVGNTDDNSVLQSVRDVLEHIPTVYIVGAQSAGKTTLLCRLVEYLCPEFGKHFNLLTGHSQTTTVVKDFRFSVADVSSPICHLNECGAETPERIDITEISTRLNELDKTHSIEDQAHWSVLVQTPGVLGRRTRVNEFSFWDVPGFTPLLSENESVLKLLRDGVNKQSLLIIVISAQDDLHNWIGEREKALRQCLKIAKDKECFVAVIVTRLDQAMVARTIQDDVGLMATMLEKIFKLVDDSFHDQVHDNVALKGVVAAGAEAEAEAERMERIRPYVKDQRVCFGCEACLDGLLGIYTKKIMSRVADARKRMIPLRSELLRTLKTLERSEETFINIRADARVIMKVKFLEMFTNSENQEVDDLWMGLLEKASCIKVSIDAIDIEDLTKKCQKRSGLVPVRKGHDVNGAIVTAINVLIDGLEVKTLDWLTQFEDDLNSYIHVYFATDISTALKENRPDSNIIAMFSPMIDRLVELANDVVKTEMSLFRADIEQWLENLKANPYFMPPEEIEDAIKDTEIKGASSRIAWDVELVTHVVKTMWGKFYGPSAFVWSTLVPRAYAMLKRFANSNQWNDTVLQQLVKYDEYGDPCGNVRLQMDSISMCIDAIDVVLKHRNPQEA